MAEPVRGDEVEALIAAFEASGCAELHLRFDGFELHLSGDAATVTTGGQGATSGHGATAPQATPTAASAVPTATTEPLEGLELVRAPYLGTFYRAPKPGEPPYVEVGADVTADSDLCLVEVMKLFTAVRAGLAGTVARILATDGAMVEAGQPLFAIQPAAG